MTDVSGVPGTIRDALAVKPLVLQVKALEQQVETLTKKLEQRDQEDLNTGMSHTFICRGTGLIRCLWVRSPHQTALSVGIFFAWLVWCNRVGLEAILLTYMSVCFLSTDHIG